MPTIGVRYKRCKDCNNEFKAKWRAKCTKCGSGNLEWVERQ